MFHLILAATRIDPLRPDNVDFGIVGPGWLAVLTFGLAAIFHGMAVAAIANRFSRAFPTSLHRDQPTRARVLTALAMLPLLLAIPVAAPLVAVIGVGLVFAMGLLRLRGITDLALSPAVTRVGRIAAVAVAVAAAYLPWTVMDLVSIAT